MQQTLVLKVGTNVLTRPDGRLDITNISHLVDQIAAAKRRGHRLILVSSGAVGAGRELLEPRDHHDEVAQRQVFSAIGQVRLMELYRQLFLGHDLRCAQLLVTKEDFRDEVHRENMLNCFRALLDDQIVPVVNENDVVAVTELMFTDNDELAGLAARLLRVDALVILSSVDGLFDGPPQEAGSRLIREIGAGDAGAEDYVRQGKSSGGRGGMGTKLRIARATAATGIPVYIGNGRRADILSGFLDGRWEGTRVNPQ